MGTNSSPVLPSTSIQRFPVPGPKLCQPPAFPPWTFFPPRGALEDACFVPNGFLMSMFSSGEGCPVVVLQLGLPSHLVCPLALAWGHLLHPRALGQGSSRWWECCTRLRVPGRGARGTRWLCPHGCSAPWPLCAQGFHPAPAPISMGELNYS